MITAPESPLGLVLAGGKSLRMKSPKAYINIDGVPQYIKAQKSLSLVCKNIYFSVSLQLQPPLPLSSELLIFDIFREPCGPLGGIISAFKTFEQQAFFVLACDMPFFDADAANYLFAHRNKNKLATVYRNNQTHIEPLCGIYEAHILEHLLLAYGKDIFCMRKILSMLDVATIDAPDEQWLKNVNYESDLSSVNNIEKTKTITVYYYASLKQKAECASEIIETKATKLADLFSELREKYRFNECYQDIRFAKNDRLVNPDEDLVSGDSVVFLPPVSGG